MAQSSVRRRVQKRAAQKRQPQQKQKGRNGKGSFERSGPVPFSHLCCSYSHSLYKGCGGGEKSSVARSPLISPASLIPLLQNPNSETRSASAEGFRSGTLQSPVFLLIISFCFTCIFYAVINAIASCGIPFVSMSNLEFNIICVFNFSENENKK